MERRTAGLHAGPHSLGKQIVNPSKNRMTGAGRYLTVLLAAAAIGVAPRAALAQPPTNQELLQRISLLESQLAELKHLVTTPPARRGAQSRGAQARRCEAGRSDARWIICTA